MNDRNDLMAGQIPGLFESAADEICYASGQSDAPGPENICAVNRETKIIILILRDVWDLTHRGEIILRMTLQWMRRLTASCTRRMKDRFACFSG